MCIRDSSKAGLRANVLVDVNLGMDRTGVPVQDTGAFFMECALMDGISMMGLHCSDGHRTEHDFDRRKKETDASAAQIQAISSSLCEKGYSCRTLVLGGSPSMPCYVDFPRTQCEMCIRDSLRGTRRPHNPASCLRALRA